MHTHFHHLLHTAFALLHAIPPSLIFHLIPFLRTWNHNIPYLEAIISQQNSSTLLLQLCSPLLHYVLTPSLIIVNSRPITGLPKHRLLNPFCSSTRTHLHPLLIFTHLVIFLSIFSTSPQEHENIISPIGSIDFHCKRIECSYSSKRIISSNIRHRNINKKKEQQETQKDKEGSESNVIQPHRKGSKE